MAGWLSQKYPLHDLATNHNVDHPFEHLQRIARSDHFNVPDLPCCSKETCANLHHLSIAEP